MPAEGDGVAYAHSDDAVRRRPFTENVAIALERLETYRRDHARVVTSRLHAYLPLRALVIDDATYTAKLEGRTLDLTFKEFELLKFLAQHPGRVFTRQQLLQEVWGYDYFGGTRTVDVHVRRLRAKLGSDHETLIGTVRNVGYRFVASNPPQSPTSDGGGTPTGGTSTDDAAATAAETASVNTESADATPS